MSAASWMYTSPRATARGADMKQIIRFSLAASLTAVLLVACGDDDASLGGGGTSRDDIIVWLSGVDESGELVVPVINLWELSGCDRTGVSSRIESGVPVRVVAVNEDCDPRMWRVEGYGANTGRGGWVSELFVRADQ